jgi:SpoVK/Ycf46/Vps4 family AAA+-type ATPase
MSFHLTKKLEHESHCEVAIRAKRGKDALFHAAKAAEFGLALATQTDEELARRYVEDAEAWLDIAERVKANPLKGSEPKVGPSSKEPLKSDGDAESSTSASEWLVTEKPDVTFDKIAGMEEAKQSIREMVVYPLKQPEKARALGLKPGGGVLLYGPPGNGKTLLGKAIAGELDAPFYYASGAQIRSKWHGESEQRLRQLIQAAKSQPIAILFLDEVEGLLPKRSGHSVVDNRIVTQFLAEIGGFEESENILLILGATNKPWDIDEAVFRTGRFDEKIYIPPPDTEARAGILRMHLDGVPAEESLDADAWAKRLEGYTGSDIVGIVNGGKRAALRRSVSENAEPTLTGSDLEDAAKTIPSSVTAPMLKQYQEFREQRFS